MKTEMEKRFWEIDFLRGTAILIMMLFHFLYNLYYFGNLNINLTAGFWSYFADTGASIFIILVGISLTLSYSRAKLSLKKERKLFLKFFRRGLMIFSWGMIITLITRIILEDMYVVFGILHFIGVSIILSYPFLKLRAWNMLIGVFFIITGVYIENLVFSFPWLIWLGLRPANFSTADYFPLLPWFGVVLIGIFLGNVLYPNHKRAFYLYDLSYLSCLKWVCLLGKHSLFIYLVHQPVLIIIMYSLGLISYN